MKSGNKLLFRILMIIGTIASILFISIIIWVIGSFIGHNKIMANAQNKGYNITQDNLFEYTIDEGGIKYYYKRYWVNACFLGYEANIVPHFTSENIVNRSVTVSVFKYGLNTYEVTVDEEGYYYDVSGEIEDLISLRSYPCYSDFTDSYFNNSQWRDPLSTHRKCYDYITSSVITPEELSDMYADALEICDELN
jgi:hypothetical protein